MNIDSARTFLEKALDLKIPLMLWGPPGVGKSTLVRETAQARGLELIDLRLAQLDATDLRGIPVPQHETRQVRWYTPSFLPTEGKGILFLDELDKASSLVKNAALQLVLDRRLGDYSLPEGWVVVCAGNREEDNAYSSPLGAALANRMLHVEVDADVDTWAAWARRNEVQEDIIGFLRFRSELLYKQTGEHAFPSPRSWAAASRLWAEADTARGSANLIAAAVGAGTASEFMGWSRIYRNVHVADILAGKLPVFPENDASFRYAVILAVAAHIAKKGAPEKNVGGLAGLLEAVTPELRVLFFKSLPAEMVAKLAAHPAIQDTAAKVVMDYVGG